MTAAIKPKHQRLVLVLAALTAKTRHLSHR